MKIQSAIAAIVISGMMAAPGFAQAVTAVNTATNSAVNSTTAAASNKARSAVNNQQTKMKACNQQAAGKTGAARKAFMKQCLSAGNAQQQTTQQQRMKDCNQQATGKTGVARKVFMKQCLSTKNH